MRSDLIKSGVDRTPHKALLKALGVTDSEMHKPFIAVVCAASDYVPGHAHLHEISRQVKDGIRNAGGVPFEFFTIGVCDGSNEPPSHPKRTATIVTTTMILFSFLFFDCSALNFASSGHTYFFKEIVLNSSFSSVLFSSIKVPLYI